MRWCQFCILPDTRPSLSIDDAGMCNACRSHASKPTIDWAERETQLHDVVAAARQRTSGYDCLVPVSGGKDSTWQVVECLRLGLHPLTVTWRPPARTPIGQRNLDNLISLGVDHVDYSISPKVEARFALKAFERLGSTAVPMHMALFSIPLSIAVRFRIPLVIWGENSAFEYGSAGGRDTGFLLDERWLRNYGVTHGTTASDWIDDDLDAKELTAYFGPSDTELQDAGVRAIFLGYYRRWDPDITHRVAAGHGFVSAGGARTGLYAYADIDDDFISIHHWLKWYKFGFTRLFDNLSLEIRNGRISRGRALQVVRETGVQTPHADIEQFCNFVGIDVPAFYSIAERFRSGEVWDQRSDGVWYIPDFLIPDWAWD